MCVTTPVISSVKNSAEQSQKYNTTIHSLFPTLFTLLPQLVLDVSRLIIHMLLLITI